MYYKLPKPCIFSMDISYPLVVGRKFDAIICDPPYGVKAGSKKTKAADKRKQVSLEENKHEPAAEELAGIFSK